MSQSPIEGFEQVESLDLDDGDEYEEEEVKFLLAKERIPVLKSSKTLYVTLDLGPTDPNLLLNASSYRLIGLDTAQPFLQIGTTIFRGDYETLLGTEILLGEPSTSSGPGSRSFVPLTTTEHRIRFKEVHLIPKEQAMTAEDDVFEDDTTTKRTLGGVSREARSAAFVPAVKSGKPPFQPPKQKRRWHKRPDGYNTDDEKDAETSKGDGAGADVGTSADGETGDPEAEGNNTMVDVAAPAAEHREGSEEVGEVNDEDEDDEMMSQDAEGSDVE